MDFCVGVGMEAILRQIKAPSTNNLLTSPSSLHVCLCMMASGATGRTSDQLLAALGYQSVEDLNSKAMSLMAALATDNGNLPPTETEFVNPSRIEAVVITAGNALWIARELSPLKPTFQKVLRDVYRAEQSYADFRLDLERIAEEINQWVEIATKGHIKELIAPGIISQETVMILVNAIYFKGFWAQPFERHMTREEDFYLLDGTRIRTPFMRDSMSRHYYGSFDGFKVLKMLYYNNNNYNGGRDEKQQQQQQFSMYIFLPTTISLEEMLLRFRRPYLSDMQNLELRETVLEKVWIPKWKFTSVFRPRGIMEDLGMTLPFQMLGEFTEMVEHNSEKICVDEVIQKAYIAVDEEGTEAAAATAIICCPISFPYTPPPTEEKFVADHPFMFTIQEEVSRAVLFLGTVLDPRKQ